MATFSSQVSATSKRKESREIRNKCGEHEGRTLTHSHTYIHFSFYLICLIWSSACDDKTCNLYDISSKMPIGNLTGHDSSVLCLESIGDGGYCVTGSSDSKTKVWEIRSRTCVQTLSEHSGPIWDLAIDNTSNLLASGSEDGTVVTYAIN